MLKMHCPDCRNIISSPLLADVKSIYCHNCKGFKKVGDLYVTANGYTFMRKHLKARFSRWERLLRDALKERETLRKWKEGDGKSLQALEKFISTMRELLDGARDHFRAYVPSEVPVTCRFEASEVAGRLLNISILGGCVEHVGGRSCPTRGARVKLDFALPNCPEPFLVPGKVAWLQKDSSQTGIVSLGVEFQQLEEPQRTSLWKCIIAHRDVAKPYCARGGKQPSKGEKVPQGRITLISSNSGPG